MLCQLVVLLAYTNRNPIYASSYYIDQICDHWWNVNFTDRDVGDLRIFHLHCNRSSKAWWYRNQYENGENAKWEVANGHWYLYTSVHHPTIFLLHGSAQSKNERLKTSTIYDNEKSIPGFCCCSISSFVRFESCSNWSLSLKEWRFYKEYPDII